MSQDSYTLSNNNCRKEMPYDMGAFRQTAIYGMLGVAVILFIDVIFAGVLGLSDAVIVVIMFILLSGYFSVYAQRNHLSTE